MPKRNFVTVPLLVALLLTAGQSGAAGNSYYRWIDERGDPVHSDRPPPTGTDYEVISAGSSLKRVVPGDEGAVPAEVKPRVGNDFKQVDTAARKEAAEKNSEFCARAKENLGTLDSAARVRVRDDDTGEFRFLTDEERNAEKAKAEKAVAEYC